LRSRSAAHSSLSRPRSPRATPSFPTRRSSDLLFGVPAAAVDRLLLFGEKGQHPLERTALPVRRDDLRSFLVELVRLGGAAFRKRSEEHTSELQSRFELVCRLLLEKKNTIDTTR